MMKKQGLVMTFYVLLTPTPPRALNTLANSSKSITPQQSTHGEDYHEKLSHSNLNPFIPNHSRPNRQRTTPALSGSASRH